VEASLSDTLRALFVTFGGVGKLSVRRGAPLLVISLAACGGNQALPQRSANCAEWERLATYVEQSKRDSYVAPDARAWIEAEAARDGCKVAAKPSQ
jgi:hypothetical protein